MSGTTVAISALVGAGQMTFQGNPRAIPFLLAGGTSAILMLFAWRRREMPRAPAFIAMMAGETTWAFAEALELIVAAPVIQLLCINLRVVGAVVSILGMLAFVLHYTGQDQWLVPRRFLAVCAVPVALILVAWTNPWHRLFWASTRVEEIGGFRITLRGYGPGFWAELGYCYLLVAVSLLLLAGAVIRSAGVYRYQAAIMLFGVLTPWVVSIIDMTHVFGVFYIDLAAASFAVTGLAFVPGLSRLRLLDLTPVAWATVVERINDPVMVIDGLGRIAVWNSAAQQLVGRPAREILAVEATRVFAGWPALAERLDRIAEDQEVRFELDGPGSAPGSCYDARIWRLGDGAHPSGWVLVLRELTERKRAEEERIRMLREQAARAEAEAGMLRERTARGEAEAASRAKDRFLATLSHELRTPLTPILATATAMLDDPTTPAAFRTVLEMIRRNVTLEARLIDDLLDLTRIRGGKLHLKCEAADAHALIHQVVEICREDLRSKGLELRLDLEARRYQVDADPARLQQVLWNLIKNAIKFTPHGGTVTIRSRDGDAVATAGTETSLIVEVSDTGIGIESDALPRIFEVFDQGGSSSARRYGGLGLGLTISRSIVEQHGGRLTAESEGNGLGATFAVTLPRARERPVSAPRDEPSEPGPSMPHRPLTILLVEDNADTLNYLSKMLALRGHDIRTADSLSAALRAAAGEDFDVLVSDIELPDGSGLELMWTLRCSRPVPGIALSGFGSSEDIEISRSAGFAEHLIKPVDFRRLEDAIQQVAAGGRIVDLVERR
jgi:signal transduction histidine kinase/ActR/RegA family two-component response regulator